jgi:hypothetical protein
MAAQAPKCQDKAMEKDKPERLAAALRENLKRRKAQARELNQVVIPAKAGTSGHGGTDGHGER